MRWGRDGLVAVACDLCVGREVMTHYVRPDGLEVVLCAACGLAFVLPRPRDELVQPLHRAAAPGLVRTYHPYVMGGTRHNLLAVLVRPSERAREDLRT
jgi:hypothetical protein